MSKRFEMDEALGQVELMEVESSTDSDYEDQVEYLEYEDFLAMGVDPKKPTRARPGSEEKVLILSARYAAGVPLWHHEDCYDHGPREMELMGAGSLSRPAPQPLVIDDEDDEL